MPMNALIPHNVELTLAALAEHNPADEVGVKPVDFQSFIVAVKQLGVFRAMLNEPPPDRARPTTTREEP